MASAVRATLAYIMKTKSTSYNVQIDMVAPSIIVSTSGDRVQIHPYTQARYATYCLIHVSSGRTQVLPVSEDDKGVSTGTNSWTVMESW